jgi:16S rRNA (adenine1518-N6/adenine1519-N6)-dimethyltransferase
MDLLRKEEVLQRLQEEGVWSKKSLGQHFLVDEKALETILEAAALDDTDTVVEIGPGMGVLSSRLLEKVERVVAFEFDPDMRRILEKDFPELEVVAGDVLKTAPQVIPDLGPYKVVANIPYQITTPLMRLFLEGGIPNPPLSMTLLVQKEVGKRFAAGAKMSDRGYLSVLIEYFSDISYVMTVPASSFFPPPKVDSAVIHLKMKPERLFPQQEEREFLKFVHRFFITPRKQLKNVVAGIRGLTSAEVEEAFAKIGLPFTARAQELTLLEWKALYESSL